MGEMKFPLIVNVTIKPSTFPKEIEHEEQRKGMENEYVTMIKNHTWKIVECPQNVKPIG